jgi:hypothetical protein
VDFNDKDYVWADGNPNSPCFGNVYASWTLFQGNGAGAPEPIVFTRSTDGGKTWSPAVRLSPSGENRVKGFRQGSIIRTGPDGTVYVFSEAVGAPSKQLVAISSNGGKSFSRPAPITTVNDIPVLPGSSYRDSSFPSVDVNQTTGATYLAWADEDQASATSLIKFTESDDGAQTWSTPITVGGSAGAVNAFFPSVAASPDGHHAFVAWPAQSWVAPGTNPGPGVVSQYAQYNVRTDGAWSGAQLLSTASGDPDGSSWPQPLNRQFLGDYTAAMSSNTTAWLTWTDTRNDAPCAAVDAFRNGAAPQPNPDLQCSSVGGRSFGNTDIFAGGVSFP